MTRRVVGLLAVLAVVLAPALSQAQVLYNVQRATGAAPTRTGYTDLTFTAGTGGQPEDAGSFNVTLPFSFNFYGTTYTSLTATVDGVILFDNEANNIFPTNPAGSRGCGWRFDVRCANTNVKALPDAGAPNNLIAFWWSDMVFAAATGDAKWTVSGAAPNRVFTLLFTNWKIFDSAAGGPKSPRTVQVELFETTNEIRVYYGAVTNTGDPGYGASVGLESALSGTSVEGITGLACSNRLTPAPARCRTADWPAGDYLSFTQTNVPDLRVDGVAVSSITAATVGGSAGYQAVLNVTVSNHGRDAANAVTADVYLTTAAATPLQTLLGRLSPTFTVGATPVTKQITVSFARPLVTPIYFAAKVDPDNTVVEADDNNNVSPLTPPLGIGIDLVATSLTTTVTDASFGAFAPFTLVITNLGTDTSSATTVDIYLSSSRTAQPTTTSLKTLSVPALTVSQAATLQDSVKLSQIGASLTAGTYYLVAVVDPKTAALPSGVNVEISETNNLVGSTGINLGFAEFAAGSLAVTNTMPPYAPLTEIHFGDTVRVAFNVANAGKPATDVEIGVYITTGTSIRPLMEASNFALDCSPKSAIQGIAFPTQPTPRLLELSCVVPALNALGQPLKPTPEVNWLIGAYVDAYNAWFEQDELNNEASKTIAITRPAPDLLFTRLDMPRTAAPGELVPITRTLRNAGVLAATFAYQYVFTANQIASAEDPVASILAGSVLAPTVTATLPAGASTDGNDLVMVPIDLAPGEYHFGAIADPANRVAELNETNNAFLAPGTIVVVGPSLNILTQALPDGIAGAPYTYQLMAVGASSAVQWELAGGGLPNGMSLSLDGVLTGSPAEPGEFDLLVHAFSGTEQAYARLGLRVIEVTMPLAVATTQLPPGQYGSEYDVQLVAVGGLRPYRWELDGAPIEGFALEPSGELHGTVSSIQRSVFHVVVRDREGNSATADLELWATDGASLFIAGVMVGTRVGPDLPVGQIGVSYSAEFQVDAAHRRSDLDLRWSIASGALPPGLRLEGAAITGIPTAVGAYPFQVQVRAAYNATVAAARYVLVVTPRAAQFEPVTLGLVQVGAPFEFDFAPHAAAGSTFTLTYGVLPQGLELSAAGLLAGTVATDTRIGSYDFVVTVTGPGGETTSAAQTLRVVAVPKVAPEAKDSGCSSAGAGPVGLGAMLLAALPLLRRRPRRHGAVG